MDLCILVKRVLDDKYDAEEIHRIPISNTTTFDISAHKLALKLNQRWNLENAIWRFKLEDGTEFDSTKYYGGKPYDNEEDRIRFKTTVRAI